MLGGSPKKASSHELIHPTLICLLDSNGQARSVEGSITRPEAIRELAWRFFASENDPETSNNFPCDAREAARILLRRAKVYEDQASAGDLSDASVQVDTSGRHRGHDNVMVGS
jgi:hypothetical protein